MSRTDDLLKRVTPIVQTELTGFGRYIIELIREIEGDT